MGLHFKIQFPGVREDVFMSACNEVEREVKALVQRAIARISKEAPMGKQQKDDDLSDILGDTDTPATKTKEKSMGSKQEKAAAAAAAVKASANKHTAKGKPAAPAAKAPASKPAKGKTAAKVNGSKREPGKFHFPVGSSEREALKSKLKKLTKPASTKEIASKLSVPTWQVRLAAVELAGEKLLKVEKTGSVMTIKPR